MAKRDPYHQSPTRFAWCRCCSDGDIVREQIRRARHAGKREAHEAIARAAEISFDRWYDEHCENEYEYDQEFACSEPEPACSVAFATLADVA